MTFNRNLLFKERLKRSLESQEAAQVTRSQKTFHLSICEYDVALNKILCENVSNACRLFVSISVRRCSRMKCYAMEIIKPVVEWNRSKGRKPRPALPTCTHFRLGSFGQSFVRESF